MSRVACSCLVVWLLACSSSNRGVGGSPPGATPDAAAPDLAASPPTMVGTVDQSMPADLAPASACKLNAAKDALVNHDGSPPDPGTPCGTCLTNATAAIFKEDCVVPDYCDPPQCRMSVDACLNDPDLPQGDMGALLGCSGYVDCLLAEYQVSNDLAAAEAVCEARVKGPHVSTTWRSAVGCGQSFCLGL